MSPVAHNLCGMNLTWIWTAIGAIAAVVSSIWSVAQTRRMHSPFGRYEQWVRIRDDHPAGSGVRLYAEIRVNNALVDLAARGRLTKIRRNQWIWIALIVLVAGPFVLLSTYWREAASWVGAVLGILIAVVTLIADWKVSRARTRARGELFLVAPKADDAGRVAEATTPPLAGPEHA